MKIPKKLKIGGFIWTVEETDKTTNESSSFGSCHYKKQRIFIDKTENQQKKEHTLIHETMHAVIWQSGLNERLNKATGITEEELVTAISMGIYDVLKNNNLLK
jgi:Zn-dependent peptidase ImmA (M78 family)